MSLDILNTDLSQFSFMYEESGIFRDGGSLFCLLSGPDGEGYELFFRVMNLFFENRIDEQGKVKYEYAEISPCHITGQKKALKWKLTWKQALTVLENVHGAVNEDRYLKMMLDVASRHAA